MAILNMNRVLFTALFSIFVFASSLVMAQDAVFVRSGIHSDYARLVFDWKKPVSYTLSQNDQGLVLTFNDTAPLSTEALDLSSITDVSSVQRVSNDNENLVVQIKTTKNEKSDYRHFKVGDRVVLDFLGKNENVTAKAPPPKTPQKEIPAAQPAPPVKKAEQKAPAKPPSKTEAASKAIVKAVANPAISVDAAPLRNEASDLDGAGRVDSDIMAEAPDLQPHVITVSLTEAVGLAAFRRGDDLWIVLDRVDINVPPQLEGPQTDKFPAFERFGLKTGTAYRLKMPKNNALRLKSEGGGLVWRLVLSPSKTDETSPALPERRFDSGSIVRGGTIFWPIQQTTKILDVPDPDIGDVLKVVTVRRASQFSGKPYEFVDFAVLESPVGLTVEPKTDIIEISRVQSGVEISRPDGLAISRSGDIQRRKMRENVTEAEDQLLDTASKMNTIFYFDSWMMGGL